MIHYSICTSTKVENSFFIQIDFSLQLKKNHTLRYSYEFYRRIIVIIIELLTKFSQYEKCVKLLKLKLDKNEVQTETEKIFELNLLFMGKINVTPNHLLSFAHLKIQIIWIYTSGYRPLFLKSLWLINVPNSNGELRKN